MIPAAVEAQLLRWRAAAAPREACGWLLVRDGVLVAVRRPNLAPDGRFLLDPRDLLALPAGDRFVGPWHSHPDGDATPSPYDASTAAAWPGTTWAIVGSEVTLWEASERGLSPLPSGRCVVESAAP